ncbi:MAG: alpha/beta hydrolase [Lachnospiraceae bacterium]|nr:alpha/beta hydrolase [Lachnospiraceae bacterium]
MTGVFAYAIEPSLWLEIAATMDRIEEAGHNSNTDKPEEINRIIKEFIIKLQVPENDKSFG